jgi:heme oxygenase (biliverdin-producing, ferredoxin)
MQRNKEIAVAWPSAAGGAKDRRMTTESPDREVRSLTGRAASADPPVLLTEILRQRTHALHTRAERSGIVNDILRGKASRYGYALLLRNLLPAYRELEAGLDAHEHSPAVSVAARREVYRAAALRSDLVQLFGPAWEEALPLLGAGEQYATRVATAAQGDGAALVAHAYTRYLGDLSGGQVMKRLLARALSLQPEELSFYNFPEIDDTAMFKERYRRALNDSAASMDIDAIAAEAMAAFELNIAVSEAVQQASTAPV